MEEPIILSGFTNVELIDFHYHLDPEDFANSYIELTAKNSTSKKRVLRFSQISDLKIDQGFHGNLTGMVVIDISARQWSDSKVEVQNLEVDPGITFLAFAMEVLVDEFST